MVTMDEPPPCVGFRVQSVLNQVPQNRNHDDHNIPCLSIFCAQLRIEAERAAVAGQGSS